MQPQIPIDHAQIEAFCQKWKIIELSLFGSVLREDFRDDSDVDVLVTFAPEIRYSLFDLVHMEEELKAIWGREVDLLTRRGVESMRNYLRRKEILNTAQTFYAS